MLGIGSAIKFVFYLVVMAVIGGGLYYVTGLRADLAQSQANEEKLTDAIAQQGLLIEQMKRDAEQKQKITEDLQARNAQQGQDLSRLENKFNQTAAGQTRDFGALAAARPDSAARAVNRGTKNAQRCFELAMGAPLNDEEKQAKTPLEANRECPTLIDPNYRPIAP
jgi:uncharacterized protein (DUF3084 family)